MRPWLRRTLIGVVALLAILGAAYYWLIVESHAPGDLAYDLDIAEIRRLANEPAGDKPGAIEVEEVAAFDFPATAIVAGDGWAMRRMPVFSYRVVYPQGSLIVDAGFGKDLQVPQRPSYDDVAFHRVQQAMEHASQIVITHEHFDHIGGLITHPHLAAILPATRLTSEQLADRSKSLPAAFPEHALDDYRPIGYDRYLALAPGVVLVKAAGHTPGSQMVYVQTADGKEVLFIGDVAWQARNIEVQRERARLMTWLFLKEDRTAVFGELAALKRLGEHDPEVQVVPGHDGDRVAALVAGGFLKRQFTEAQPSS